MPKKVRGKWKNLDSSIPRRSVFTSSYVPNVDGWAQDVEGQVARDISIAAQRAGLKDGNAQHAELRRILPEPLGGFLPDFYLVYLELEFDELDETFVIDEVANGIGGAEADPFHGIIEQAGALAEAMPYKSVNVLNAARAIEGVAMTVEDDPDEETDPDFARRAAELEAYAQDAEGDHGWTCNDCDQYSATIVEARAHSVATVLTGKGHTLVIDDGALEDAAADDGEDG